MSSKELIHSINNQLTVVMGRAELLSRAPLNEESQRACVEIRAAAGNLNRLIREYMHNAQPDNGN
jgi:signal transduction histidine kinase